MTIRPSLCVHLLPSLVPVGALRGSLTVVIDVLRATTVMVQALASGCEAVIPCLEIDEARRAAQSLPKGTALQGGERHGLPIEGFDLGNSPGDYTPEACQGKTLVITTTNGTKAILACMEAERVLVASFANGLATGRLLMKEGVTRPVHIVCAGTEGEISLEDTLLAGELVLRCARAHKHVRHWSEIGRKLDCNDQALIAAAAAWTIGSPSGSTRSARVRERLLKQGRGGRRVQEIGLAVDIEAAAGKKQIKLVAELRRDPLRIVRAESTK